MLIVFDVHYTFRLSNQQPLLYQFYNQFMKHDRPIVNGETENSVIS